MCFPAYVHAERSVQIRGLMTTVPWSWQSRMQVPTQPPTTGVVYCLRTLVHNLLIRKPCVLLVEFFSANGEVMASLRFSHDERLSFFKNDCELQALSTNSGEHRWDSVQIKWFEEHRYLGSVDTWSLKMLKNLEDKLGMDTSLQYIQLRRIGGQTVAWHRAMQSPEEARRLVLDMLEVWQLHDQSWLWPWPLSLFHRGLPETHLFTRHELRFQWECDDAVYAADVEYSDGATLSRSSNPFDHGLL